MKALSVRAPWWWFILHGGKNIENRDWPTRFRGTVCLHAGKWWSSNQVAGDIDFCSETSGIDMPWLSCWSKLREQGGCIVGKVDIVDCVSASNSPWFFGKYGFVLKNPVAFQTPIPFKGALGFFDVPDEIEVVR